MCQTPGYGDVKFHHKDPIPDDCKEIPDNIKQSGESDPSRDRGSMEQGKDGYDR